MAGEIAVKYEITPEQIEAKREQYAALTVDTPAGYEAVRVAIGDCRATWVAVEKRRVELKADALSYGRRVDSVAKQLTGLLESIEEPLKLLKSTVDEERERVRAEKEAANRRQIEEALQKQREEKEAQERAAREALRVEREAIEAGRIRLAVEKDAAQRAEFERQARVKAEAEARELARLEAIMAEEERVAAAERAEANRLRLEALKPDKEKILAFAATLRNLSPPKLSTVVAGLALSSALALVGDAADYLKEWAADA